MLAFVIPGGCAVVCAVLFVATTRRLLHPPDVGAEAKDVVDPDLEQRKAVGMVIRSDQFPDKLFAPPKRTDLMARRAESGLRQGDAERAVRPGDADAAAGDPVEHVPGAVR